MVARIHTDRLRHHSLVLQVDVLIADLNFLLEVLLEQGFLIQKPMVVHVATLVIPEELTVTLSHKLNPKQTFVWLVMATEK